MRLRQVPMGNSSPKRDLLFSGLNRNEFIGDNEIKAGTNLSSEFLPALSPRLPREAINEEWLLTEPRHIFTAGGKLCWIDGNNFVYDGVIKGTVDGSNVKSMVDFNGAVVIFPEKSYYIYDELNVNYDEFAKFGIGDCDTVADFDAINCELGLDKDYPTYRAHLTSEFKSGDNCIICTRTADGEFGLQTANAIFKRPDNYSTDLGGCLFTANVYGSIFAEAKLEVLGDGDIVIATSQIKTLNGKNRIGCATDALAPTMKIRITSTMSEEDIAPPIYIAVDCIQMDALTLGEYHDAVSDIEKVMLTKPPMPTPTINFASQHYNRIFGCKDSNVYASAWGDFKTWSSFKGTNQDSYATDVSTEGNFTGIFTYGNHVTIFKDNFVDEMYGSLPRNFQLMSMSGYGAISNDAIAEGGGTLMFADARDIFMYTGGRPVPIGGALNEKNYIDVKIESDGKKFYVLIIKSAQDRALYCYDIDSRSWLPEDNLDVVGFTSLENKVYALTTDGKIWRFNSGTETISWTAETKVYDDAVFDKKRTKNIKLKLKMPSGSSLSIYSKKNDGAWTLEHTVTNEEATDEYKVVRKVVKVNRADRYQLKFAGTGNILVYGEREFDVMTSS